MGSPYLFNGLFFSLPWFYRSGYDVLLYTLPFHGARAEKGSSFSGYGYFAHGFAGFAEAMAQAVHDFRSLIPNVPVVAPDRTVDEWFPANYVVRWREAHRRHRQPIGPRRHAVPV